MAWLMGGGAPKSDMSYLDENAAFLGAASGATPTGATSPAAANASKINPAAAQFLASMLKGSSQPGLPAAPPIGPLATSRPPTNAGDFLRQAMMMASLRELAGGGRGGA